MSPEAIACLRAELARIDCSRWRRVDQLPPHLQPLAETLTAANTLYDAACEAVRLHDADPQVIDAVEAIGVVIIRAMVDVLELSELKHE